jgi:hypothetical protein
MPDHASSSPNPRTGLVLATPPNMRLVFERPDDGTELVHAVTGVNPPLTVEVRFEPLTATERLSGEPSQWCNSPDPGQALVYAVPVALGGITSGTLKVGSTSTGVITQIPIKVKHNA